MVKRDWLLANKITIGLLDVKILDKINLIVCSMLAIGKPIHLYIQHPNLVITKLAGPISK